MQTDRYFLICYIVVPTQNTTLAKSGVFPNNTVRVEITDNATYRMWEETSDTATIRSAEITSKFEIGVGKM